MIGKIEQKRRDEYENKMIGILEDSDHLEDDNTIVQIEKPNWLTQLEKIGEIYYELYDYRRNGKKSH